MPLALLQNAARAGTRRLTLESLAPSLQTHPAGQALLGALKQTGTPDALRFLRATAISCILHRGQWQPKACAIRASSAPPQTRPGVQEPPGRQAMHELLHGDVSYWGRDLPRLHVRLRLLRSMQRHRQSLPHALLPHCLGRDDEGKDYQRPLMLPVLGTHGRWLARLGRPKWKWAVDGTALEELDAATHGADDIWQRGGMQQRLALLQRERMLEPARARQRLEQGFARGGGLLMAARERFFAAMACNLSMEDEPFLERCLKDRSDFVQTFAAELLSALPRSRHSQRICAALLALVQRETGGQWQLALPQKFDAAWAHDDVSEGCAWWRNKPGYPHTWWLHQLVSHAPLSFWVEAALAPERLSTSTAQESAIHSGWLKAAFLAMQAQQNLPADWLNIILDMEEHVHGQADLRSVRPWLDAARREDFWRAQLQRGKRSLWDLAQEMHQTLEASGHSLSPGFSQCLLQHIRQDLAHALCNPKQPCAPLAAHEQQTDFSTRLGEIVLLLHHSTVADFAAWWQGVDWQSAFGAGHRETTSHSGMVQTVQENLHWCEKLHQCEQAMEALAA